MRVFARILFICLLQDYQYYIKIYLDQFLLKLKESDIVFQILRCDLNSIVSKSYYFVLHLNVVSPLKA